VDYETEQFVKIYTRDTPDFLELPLWSRCLLFELVRKADRAGRIGLGRNGLRGVAVLLRAPFEEIEPHLSRLIADKRIVYDQAEQQLIIPNHVEAQTARVPQSVRAQQYRDRKESRSDVTSRHEVSRAVTRVTQRHEPSHASRAVTLDQIDQIRLDRIEEREAPTVSESAPGVNAPSLTTSTPDAQPARPRTGAMADGCMGMTADAWRQGVASSTKATVSHLSRFEQEELQRLIDAHARDPSTGKPYTGDRLMEWVQKMAAEFAREEIENRAKGRYAGKLTPKRADQWITAHDNRRGTAAERRAS
jgi:hypothetical protein